MRYRPLSPLGDYTIGVPFYVNSPQAVAQAIQTRLNLWLGEWFLDITDGTDWRGKVLGERYNKAPDAEIKRRILGTPGVQQLITYSSVFAGGAARTLTVSGSVQSQFSVTPVPFSTTVPTGA